MKHIQNPATEHYLAISRYIQNLAQRLHTQKPGILGIMEYSEPFHNYIPTHIQNPLILQKFTNIQNSGIFKTRHVQNPLKDSRLSFFWKK